MKVLMKEALLLLKVMHCKIQPTSKDDTVECNKITQNWST